MGETVMEDIIRRYIEDCMGPGDSTASAGCLVICILHLPANPLVSMNIGAF